MGEPDTRQANEKRDLLATTLPDMAVGPHAAALGIAFARDRPVDARIVYVARHGSWNRSSLSGYDVPAVSFSAGWSRGDPQLFLTDFVADETASTVYGRPVSVQTLADGSLFVVDDAGDTIWLVRRGS